jgi:hypothetical protein
MEHLSFEQIVRDANSAIRDVFFPNAEPTIETHKVRKHAHEDAGVVDWNEKRGSR